MPEITLVRQDAAPIAPQDAEAARRVFFGIVDGLGERGRKQWRRLWNGLMRLEPGEMVEITTVQPRLGWFHRRHMALEQAVFEAQERFEDFESFRTWLKVGASFVDWYPGPKGGVIPVPRSISYSKLDQGAMFTKAVRRELEPVWAADTMRKLWEMGLVPDSLKNQVAALIDKAR